MKGGIDITNSVINEIGVNNKGTPMKIISVGTKSNITVEFMDDHHFKKNTTYLNFRRGQVKNPYDVSVLGVGYIGYGKYKVSDSKRTSTRYYTWTDMLDRCYSNRPRYPAYEKCTVCDEWLNYQLFCEWYDAHKYDTEGRLHIDKDILYPNCKIYSPETCMLVPQRINMLFLNKPNKRGLPNGISKSGNLYEAKYNAEIIGKYSTLEEAFDNYSKYKEKAIREIAEEYKDTIPRKLYDALLNYKCDIKNDCNYAA